MKGARAVSTRVCKIQGEGGVKVGGLKILGTALPRSGRGMQGGPEI